MSSLLKRIVLHFLPQSRMLIKAPGTDPVLYLTFDDGPNTEFTESLLDLLAQHNVKASFFCIGKFIKVNPKIASRITRESHDLLNHSFCHWGFNKLSILNKMADIEETNSLIHENSGLQCKYFRVPRGQWSFSLLLKLWFKDIIPVHWSYDSNDFQEKDQQQLYNHFIKRPVTNGDIILFHDDNAVCIHALEELLPKWKSEGFKFSLISDIKL